MERQCSCSLPLPAPKLPTLVRKRAHKTRQPDRLQASAQLSFSILPSPSASPLWSMSGSSFESPEVFSVRIPISESAAEALLTRRHRSRSSCHAGYGNGKEHQSNPWPLALRCAVSWCHLRIFHRTRALPDPVQREHHARQFDIYSTRSLYRGNIDRGTCLYDLYACEREAQSHLHSSSWNWSGPVCGRVGWRLLHWWQASLSRANALWTFSANLPELYSLNPARSFGPCVITGVFDQEHWIYCMVLCAHLAGLD